MANALRLIINTLMLTFVISFFSVSYANVTIHNCSGKHYAVCYRSGSSTHCTGWKSGTYTIHANRFEFTGVCGNNNPDYNWRTKSSGDYTLTCGSKTGTLTTGSRCS